MFVFRLREAFGKSRAETAAVDSVHGSRVSCSLQEFASVALDHFKGSRRSLLITKVAVNKSNKNLDWTHQSVSI